MVGSIMTSQIKGRFNLLLITLVHTTAALTIFFPCFAYSSTTQEQTPPFSQRNMPQTLYEGMIKFSLNSGNYFDALVLMDEPYKKAYPINFAAALQGFNLNTEVQPLLGDLKREELSDEDLFTLGKTQYRAENCKPALRAFKLLKNKLSLEDKQKWAFYRSNCFIKLGSNGRSAKVLSDMLGGVWASYAYFDLAMAYAQLSRNKTKAMVALRVAGSFLNDKTKEEKSLSDRINLAAGALYLEANKPEKAVGFFKKVYLESDSAPRALFLNGLALLDLGEFRSAIQTWYSVKNYSLVNQSVDEALLAIPYAFERSGYISQALDAYLKASASFKRELGVIDKIDGLLEKYGAQKILFETNEIKGLEWFLAKDVNTHTTRAAYYKYFVQDYVIYDQIELMAELKMLDEGLDFWSSQLNVFDRSLKEKRKSFKHKIAKFNGNEIKNKIARYGKNILALKNNNKLPPALQKNLQIKRMVQSVHTLEQRLVSVQKKIKLGQGNLRKQLKESEVLKNKVNAYQKQMKELFTLLDKQITGMVRQSLKALKVKMSSNSERAEQGLVHILESIAESKRVPKAKPKKGQVN